MNIEKRTDLDDATGAVASPARRTLAWLAVSILKFCGCLGIIAMILFSLGLEWDVTPAPLWIDKDRHFLAFYMLSSVGLIALASWPRWELIMCLVLLGGGIEIVQPYFGRERSMLDFIFDCAGIFFAFLPILLGRIRRLLRQYLQ